MFTLLKRLCFLLLALFPSIVLAIGFNSQPTIYAYNSGISFEIGEDALNSFLAAELKAPIILGSGSGQVTATVKRAEFDFENGSGKFHLRLLVSYAGSNEMVSVTRNLNPNNDIFYSSATNQVKAFLPLMFASTSLPSSVKTLLNTRFTNFNVYSRDLFTNIGGLLGVPAVGTQVHSAIPTFYMGLSASAMIAQFQDDIIRITISPTWETEPMRVQGYRYGYNPTSLVFITNFAGEIYDIWCFPGGSTGTAFALPGVFQLVPEATFSNIRTRRFNFSTNQFYGSGNYVVVAKIKTHDNRVVWASGHTNTQGSGYFSMVFN